MTSHDQSSGEASRPQDVIRIYFSAGDAVSAELFRFRPPWTYLTIYDPPLSPARRLLRHSLVCLTYALSPPGRRYLWQRLRRLLFMVVAFAAKLFLLLLIGIFLCCRRAYRYVQRLKNKNPQS